jgi:hypothetical protein
VVLNKRRRFLDLKNEKPTYNNAYSLWRVNGYQQGFPSVASFGFGGQKSASKPPQAICKLTCKLKICDNQKK